MNYSDDPSSPDTPLSEVTITGLNNVLERFNKHVYPIFAEHKISRDAAFISWVIISHMEVVTEDEIEGNDKNGWKTEGD